MTLVRCVLFYRGIVQDTAERCGLGGWDLVPSSLWTLTSPTSKLNSTEGLQGEVLGACGRERSVDHKVVRCKTCVDQWVQLSAAGQTVATRLKYRS